MAAKRLNKGYSIRGLARKLEVHEQSVRRFEQRIPIRPETAKTLADFYGVRVTDIYPVQKDVAA